MSFAAEGLRDRYDDIAAIVSRKGAYQRFKNSLVSVGTLEDCFPTRPRPWKTRRAHPAPGTDESIGSEAAHIRTQIHAKRTTA